MDVLDDVLSNSLVGTWHDDYQCSRKVFGKGFCQWSA